MNIVQGLHEKAQTSLLKLMESVEVKRNISNGQTSGSCITNLNDNASCFLYLCMVKISLKQDEEALKLIISAGDRFQGSTQSFALAKLSSDLHLKQGDITNSLKPFDYISMVRNALKEYVFSIHCLSLR